MLCYYLKLPCARDQRMRWVCRAKILTVRGIGRCSQSIVVERVEANEEGLVALEFTYLDRELKGPQCGWLLLLAHGKSRGRPLDEKWSDVSIIVSCSLLPWTVWSLPQRFQLS